MSQLERQPVDGFQHLARQGHRALSLILLLLVLCFFIALGLFLGTIVHNPATPQTSQAASQCTSLPVSAVGASWQDQMDVGGSQVIDASLTNKTGDVGIPAAVPKQSPCPHATPTSPPTATPSETPTPTRPRASPTPIKPSASFEGAPNVIGTPGVPLAQAFGAGYQGYASARLEAIGFDSVPVTATIEQLDQAHIAWDWTISPKGSGQQYVVLAIDGVWKPLRGTGPTIQRQIWTSQPVQIGVQQPFFQRNPFDFLGFLTTSTGASSLLVGHLRCS